MYGNVVDTVHLLARGKKKEKHNFSYSINVFHSKTMVLADQNTMVLFLKTSWHTPDSALSLLTSVYSCLSSISLNSSCMRDPLTLFCSGNV